ncbi:thermonuclease family protein [Devosia sp.]|uniref:thermonuclease family protein n=1 Tax=Devosia sp. TaxID=1871048 RepID=UPI003BAB3CEF
MLLTPPVVAARGSVSALFSACGAAVRTECVVDGDTFYHAGVKIRIADIDTPEVHDYGCAAEKALGDRATVRLMSLLNAGPFALEAGTRDTDRYGRKLRVVLRDGHSLGEVLVAEGLARRWDGSRHPWC